jgi:hypothetical protein
MCASSEVAGVAVAMGVAVATGVAVGAGCANEGVVPLQPPSREAPKINAAKPPARSVLSIATILGRNYEGTLNWGGRSPRKQLMLMFSGLYIRC